MRIFLTGGTGFIGSHFLRQALAAGHQVTALRRSATSRPRIALAQEPVWLNRAMPEVTPDELAGHDVLVHLAAVGVSPQKADWATLLRVNVTESLALWLQAAEAGLDRFVICGSCFEFGKSGERYEFIPPDAPLEPTTAYAASKAAATMTAVALARERGLRMMVARPFHTFGEGQHESNLWPSLQRAALAGEDFPMTPGDQVRDYTPVEEIARQLLAAAELVDVLPGHPSIRNLGAGRPESLRGFAESWWTRWNASGRLLFGAQDYRPDEVMRYVPKLSEFSVPGHSG